MKKRLVILGTDWCLSCKELYKKLVKEFGDENVEYINIEKYPHLSSRYRISGYPAIAYLESDELRYLETTLELDEIRENYKFMDTLSIGDDIFRCLMKYGSKELGRDTILRIISNIERDFDWINGGLKGEFKRFPYDIAEFMIRMFLESGVEGYLRMIHKTVDIILQSLMFDYGRSMVSRISYSPDWDEPDYVYLVEDQARFAKILVYIYLLTKNKIYLDLARDMVKSINKNFLTQNGIYRAYVGDRPVEPIYPHILYNALSSLAEASVVKEVSRYTVNMIRYMEDLDSVIDYRGYIYLGDLLEYGNASIRFYEVFRWERGLKLLNRVIERLESLKGNMLYKDVDKPVLNPFDSWKCIPIRENIGLSGLLHRYAIHIDSPEIMEVSRKIVGRLSPHEIKDLNILSQFGFVLANHINGVDILVVSGYERIPLKALKMFKPYTVITYREQGERYIEYISKDFRFRI